MEIIFYLREIFNMWCYFFRKILSY